MRRAPLRAALALVAFALAVASAAAEESARPRIYKWVDENGIAHYTTDRGRIPSNLRGRIRDADSARGAPAPAGDATTTDAPAAATDTGSGAPVSDTGGAAPAAPPAPSAPSPGTSTPRGTAAPARAEQWSLRDAGPAEPEVRGTGTPEPDPDRIARARELETQIADLEAAMAKDEERLKELIGAAREVEGQPAPLYGVPELEELAKRFPKLQADLSALRAERRRLDEEP
jgi:hypothetical protein